MKALFSLLILGAVAAAPITEDGGSNGFSVAMIVSGAASQNNLPVHAGWTFESLAQDMVEKLEEEFFHVDVNGLNLRGG